jgi:hypothetical protein
MTPGREVALYDHEVGGGVLGYQLDRTATDWAG